MAKSKGKGKGKTKKTADEPVIVVELPAVEDVAPTAPLEPEVEPVRALEAVPADVVVDVDVAETVVPLPRSGRSAEDAAPVPPAPVVPPAPAVSPAVSPRAARTSSSVTVPAASPVAGWVRGVLPTERVPFYLGATALIAFGLIDPPAALGIGLAYEALRRWSTPATP